MRYFLLFVSFVSWVPFVSCLSLTNLLDVEILFAECESCPECTPQKFVGLYLQLLMCFSISSLITCMSTFLSFLFSLLAFVCIEVYHLVYDCFIVLVSSSPNVWSKNSLFFILLTCCFLCSFNSVVSCPHFPLAVSKLPWVYKVSSCITLIPQTQNLVKSWG